MLGILAVLRIMAQLRRDPTLAARLHDAGNILGMHDVGDLPKSALDRDLGHVWFVALAALVTVAARAVPRREALVASLGTAFTLGAVYLDSISRWMTTVGGRFVFGMSDDALISMRYARNLAEGRGLVYNVGEHVEGFTNPLWTFLMAIPFALHMDERTAPLPISLLAGALLVAAALLGRAVLAREGAPLPVQVLGAFAIFLDASSFEFAAIGLETPLLTMASALVLYAARARRPRLAWLGLVLLTLARADGVLVAGALLGWLVFDDWRSSGEPLVAVGRRHGKAAAVVAATTVALLAWRLALYGHLAPNTAYLKVYPLAARLPTGLATYGVRGLVMYGLPAATVLLAGLDARTRFARRLLLPVAGVWLYSIYVGGDAFNFMRFLGPITPLLWVALGLVVASGWERRAAGVNALVFGAVSLVVPIRSELGALGTSLDHDGWMDRVLVAAKTVERNVPADATVAVFWAGVPYYAPNHRFIDLLGKTESHIAHGTEIHGAVPGHNKFDFRWIYEERKPDVTFTEISCEGVQHFLDAPEAEQQAWLDHDRSRPSYFQAASAQLADPSFRRLYAPHRVDLRENGKAVGHTFGCWFVREGSPVPLTWEVARQ